MASISKRPNGQQRARYRDAAGKEHAKDFATKKAAQAWLDVQTAALVTHTWVDPDRSKMPTGIWADKWIATRVDLKPSTHSTYTSLIKCWIRPQWGDVPLSAIENAEIGAWVAKIHKGGLGASRTRQAHRVFSEMLDAAVADKRLPANPAKVALPRKTKKPHRYLTHDQVAALADASGRYATLVRAFAYCGLRFGEAAALRVKRVDLVSGRLDIAEAMAEVDGVAVFGTPKTHQVRSVPVPGFMRAALAEQLVGKSGDDFVFASPRGDVLRNNNFRRNCWNAATKSVAQEGLTPHELRHTCASFAIAAGATVKGVQGLLGHESAAVTLDIYAHLFPDELDAVADRLDLAARASAEILRTKCGQNVVDLSARRARKGA